ncbi:Ras protein [Mycena venus]|uniref:Ras protein n=1 Tax=Mycena venus TaxID=2733690 RepID=A0A8H6YTT2_9AGAR|nr:Ras protein [Mycena venus]
MDQWRVTVLGDGGVGKTALAVQTYDPTIEDAYRKQFVVDDRYVRASFFGIPRFAVMAAMWRSTQHSGINGEGQGFILLYSITSRSTFNRLEVFRQSVRRAKRGNPILLLVGNKCDRPLDREVSREEGAALARQFGCDFFETSAKTGLNVERVFTALVCALRPTKAISAGAKESAKDVKKKCIIL